MTKLSFRTRNFFSGGGVTHPRDERNPEDSEGAMGCDYNGWADMPEEERETLEAFEAGYDLQPRAADVTGDGA